MKFWRFAILNSLRTNNLNNSKAWTWTWPWTWKLGNFNVSSFWDFKFPQLQSLMCPSFQVYKPLELWELEISKAWNFGSLQVWKLDILKAQKQLETVKAWKFWNLILRACKFWNYNDWNLKAKKLETFLGLRTLKTLELACLHFDSLKLKRLGIWWFGDRKTLKFQKLEVF